MLHYYSPGQSYTHAHTNMHTLRHILYSCFLMSALLPFFLVDIVLTINTFWAMNISSSRTYAHRLASMHGGNRRTARKDGDNYFHYVLMRL